jgi:CheY-like chemotaxis protein
MSEKRRFLIVDDDRDDREFFGEAIATFCQDAQCIPASNGDEALRKLRDGADGIPDFVFLDLNMPLMDGRSFLKVIKEEESFKHIPVIIFTTSSNPKDKADTMRMGASYFLTKPVSFKKLCEDLAHAIESIDAKNAEKKLN